MAYFCGDNNEADPNVAVVKSNLLSAAEKIEGVGQ